MPLKGFGHMSIVAGNTIFPFLLQDALQKQHGNEGGEGEHLSQFRRERTHRLKNCIMASKSH